MDIKQHYLNKLRRQIDKMPKRCKPIALFKNPRTPGPIENNLPTQSVVFAANGPINDRGGLERTRWLAERFFETKYNFGEWDKPIFI